MDKIFDTLRNEAEIEAAATLVYSALLAENTTHLALLLSVQIENARDSAKDAAVAGYFLDSFVLDFYASCLEKYRIAILTGGYNV